VDDVIEIVKLSLNQDSVILFLPHFLIWEVDSYSAVSESHASMYTEMSSKFSQNIASGFCLCSVESLPHRHIIFLEN